MKTCCAVELLLGLPLSLEPLLGYSQAIILPVIFPGDLGLRGEDNSLPWVSSSSLTLSGCQQHQEAASICGMRKVVPNVPEFIFLLLHKASTRHRLPRKDEWKINRHCGIFFFCLWDGWLPGRAPFCRTEDPSMPFLFPPFSKGFHLGFRVNGCAPGSAAHTPSRLHKEHFSGARALWFQAGLRAV